MQMHSEFPGDDNIWYNASIQSRMIGICNAMLA